MMRITSNAVDALYRVALAEHYTSSTQAATYDLKRMILKLEAAKYVKYDGFHFVLTEAGEKLLSERASITKTLELAKLRGKKA